MKLTRRELILGSAMTVLSGCAKPSPAKASEGRIGVPGGTVVWRRFGDGPKTPLLLIHGGPGFPSDYLQPFDALGDERPVYVWDQLGCGRPTGRRIRRFGRSNASSRNSMPFERS